MWRIPTDPKLVRPVSCTETLHPIFLMNGSIGVAHDSSGTLPITSEFFGNRHFASVSSAPASASPGSVTATGSPEASGFDVKLTATKNCCPEDDAERRFFCCMSCMRRASGSASFGTLLFTSIAYPNTAAMVRNGESSGFETVKVWLPRLPSSNPRSGAISVSSGISPRTCSGPSWRARQTDFS